jgi:integrase
LILTGMRRGELCGLRWADADLDRGVLTVSRTLLQLGGKLTERPKTAAVSICSAAGERRRLRAGIPGRAGGAARPGRA